MLASKKHSTWFPSLFNEFMGNEWVTKVTDSLPAINIMECEKCFRVEISTPGMTKEDFTVEIKSENRLDITMEKRCKCTDKKMSESDEEENDETPVESVNNSEAACCSWNEERDEDMKSCKYLRKDFTYSQFRQTLILPDTIDKMRIAAKQENGILSIKLPKKDSYIESQSTKRITVD